MDRKQFNRLFVTPVLPYKQGSYDIDTAALRKFLRYFMQPKFVNAGGAIIINPVAGEIFFLSREEKKSVVKIAVEECGGKVPVFAGATDWTTSDTVDVAKDAKQAGADGIFLIPPSGPSDITISWNSVKHPEIWLDIIKEIDKAVDLPMIGHPTVVEVPGWGRSLALEPTLKMCNEVPNIVGWKMTYSYENYKKIAFGLRSLDHHVAVLAGFAGNFIEYITCDIFDGTATGDWNYALELMVDQIGACKMGNLKEARRIAGVLRSLQHFVHEDKVHHHLRYKIGAWLRGLIPSPYMRPPMPRPDRTEIFAMRDLLRNAGLTVIRDEEIMEGLNTKI
jgi:dihydrodipicolinate synthase/N-acetylneuraminate lyase